MKSSLKSKQNQFVIGLAVILFVALIVVVLTNRSLLSGTAGQAKATSTSVAPTATTAAPTQTKPASGDLAAGGPVASTIRLDPAMVEDADFLTLKGPFYLDTHAR
jgi:hypothetical protein